MIFHVLDFPINHHNFPQISIQIFQIFYKLSVFPYHGFPTQNSSNMHLFRINFLQFVHNGKLILFCENDYFIFLREPFEEILKTWPENGFDASAEDVL